MQKQKKSPSFAMSRRAFLKLTALTGAAATVSCTTKNPEPLFSKEEIEGVVTEKWVPTSCLNCQTRCAINVRVVNNRAVRIVGNAKSAYSEGKTCPRAHVGLQVLYNPERFATLPLQRNPGHAKGDSIDLERDFTEISWNEALSVIRRKLLDTPADRLLLLQGLRPSSDEDLIYRFAQACGTTNLLTEDAIELDANHQGKRMADGRGASGYDLANTNYVLAFGANIVESEHPLARNLRMWGKMRRERPNRAKVVAFDPRYSVTAAKADEWIPIKPGTEGALAMAIANVIVEEKLFDAQFIENWTSGFENYKELVSHTQYSPERVASLVDVGADLIRRIAREFARSKPAIAWSGRGATSWPHGTYASHAIFCLNALVGSIDIPGGIVYQEYPPYQAMMPGMQGDDPRLSFRHAAELLLGHSVDLALGFHSNLIMSVPDQAKWHEALKRVPFYVHIGSARNEMVSYSDIVLPACTYLEEWAYENTLPGSGYAEVKIKQPVVEPLFNSRPVAQIILDIAKMMGTPTSEAFERIGNDPEGFVRHRTDPFIKWDSFKADGVWRGEDHTYGKYAQTFLTESNRFEFKSDKLGQVLKVEAALEGESSAYPFVLETYRPVMDIWNGNQNYPWAQEMFLVMHGRGWNNYIEINRETARHLKINDGDLVWVESKSGKLKATARVIEGIRPDTIAIALGQGHYCCGEWADRIGVNPNEIIELAYDEASGQAACANTRVKVYKA